MCSFYHHSSMLSCSMLATPPPSPSQAPLSNHHFSLNSPEFAFFSRPPRGMRRLGKRDASWWSRAGLPLGQKLTRVDAAFSAPAHRVAAPAALTEHCWLAKLSSHTTWRGRGCAHAPPAGGRRAATALSAESLGPRLDGGRDCAASISNRGLHQWVAKHQA